MLQSKNIYLAPIHPEDYELLFQWINDRDTVLFNSSYKPIHRNMHQEWFETITKREDQRIFGIRLKGGEKLIGTCQLTEIDQLNRLAQLQIRIGNDSERGKGYGTEAIRLLLKYAFNDLNLNRVYLFLYANNERAYQSYLKAGFKREGLLRSAAYIDGKYTDVVVMGVLREECEK
jgi:RimJ/RimL family protein N-acetyltransferase